jgi:hypothetical protein
MTEALIALREECLDCVERQKGILARIQSRLAKTKEHQHLDVQERGRGGCKETPKVETNLFVITRLTIFSSRVLKD